MSDKTNYRLSEIQKIKNNIDCKMRRAIKRDLLAAIEKSNPQLFKTLESGLRGVYERQAAEMYKIAIAEIKDRDSNHFGGEE